MPFTRLYPALLVASFVLQQNAPAADIASGIEKAKREHAARVARIHLQVKDAEKNTIKRLRVLALEAVKGGDLPTANKAWKEVLTLDRSHKEARDFFEAIGKLENIFTDLPTPGTTTLPVEQQLLRQKIVDTVWATHKKQFQFRADGKLLSSTKEYGIWSVFHSNSVIIKHPGGFFDLLIFDQAVTKYEWFTIGKPKTSKGSIGRGQRIK
jgi:hypothetical protein